MGYSSNSSSLPENLSSDQKKAIQELTHGRELANHLKVLLSKPMKNESCDSDDDLALLGAGDLVTKILGTFKNSLLFLNYAAAASDQEVTGVPAITGGSSDGVDHKAEEAADSGESSKVSSAFKDRRGCYKRRRTAEAVTKYSRTLIEDDHAWRKYGQKVILNAKYPRNYFRCTHKFDQGCQATKQVQRMDEDPPIYRTIYHGHHTCRNDDILLKPPQFILDNHDHPTSDATDSKSVLISFDMMTSMNHNNNTNHHYQSSSVDHFLSSPNTYNNNANAFGSSEMLSPNPVASDDHGDVISSGVYSSTTSNHSFEMDMMVGLGGHMHFDDDVIDSFLL